jgi:hypothetical protein
MARDKKRTADNLSTGWGSDKDKKSLTPVRHGLYCNPSKVRVDGRSHFARKRRKLRESFLEGFDFTPSPRVRALADGAAVNWILLEALRTSFLRGEVVAPSVLKDYVALSNSLARDLSTLEALVKEGGEGKTLTLAEYINALDSGKLQVVRGEAG